MKKSHYLNNLNQNHEKIPLNIDKTFKQLKKLLKPKSTKVDKSKNSSNRPKNTPYLSIPKGTQDKQNQHPNIHLKVQNDLRFIKKSESILFHPDSNTVGNEKQKLLKIPQMNIPIHNNATSQFKSNKFNLSLTKCNFQPTHSAENLYLIETQGQKQLIVCEKCSQKFSKRTKVAQIMNSNTFLYSYAQFVQHYESLQQQSKKIKRIQFIEMENLHQNLNKISTYYTQLIQTLIYAKDQLEGQLIEIYEKNSLKLAEILEKNQRSSKLLDRKIEEMEKKCIHEGEMKDFDDKQIDEILLQKTDSQIELCSIDLKIPVNITEDFEADFKSSKYCIMLFKQEQEGKSLQIKNSNEVIQEVLEANEQTEEKIVNIHSKASLSIDFEKELPFKVEFSATGSKNMNFSNKVDGVISRASSTEELLIQSVRERDHGGNPLNPQNKLLGVNVLSVQNEKHNNIHNFKTQSSSHRLEDAKQEKSLSKKNFIKQLHVEQDNQFDDMICDEDLSVSYSHPIYQNQPIKSRNFLKNSNKSSNKLINPALSLSQLDSQFARQITHPSLITASQNKHDISFQLDENLIIDANILPEDNDSYQNLDIISPAFKLI